MSEPQNPPNSSEQLAELRRRLLSSGGRSADAVPPPPPAEPEPPSPPRSSTAGVPRLVTPGARPQSHVHVRPDVDRIRAAGTYGRRATDLPPGVDYTEADPVQRLQIENAELRSLLEEMKPILEEAQETEQRYASNLAQIKEQLAVRDQRIEELEANLAEIEEQIHSGELVPRPKTRSELEEWSDELEKESSQLNQQQRRLEADRQQLREDEEALEKQMRGMEVQMARERALLARQETELKRLNAEILRELELMQRGDTALRERMSMFQRRHQEVMTRGSPTSVKPARELEPLDTYEPPVSPSSPTPPPRDSGLIRRLFGRDE